MGPDRIYRFGIFELRGSTGELRRAGVRLRLARQVATLLVVLLERPGELVLRRELQERLWPDTHVDRERGLTNVVNRLRDVLGDTSSRARFIETVPTRGYRFVAPVEVVDIEPAARAAESSGGTRGRSAAVAVSVAAGIAFAVAGAVMWTGLGQRGDSPARPFYLAAVQLQDQASEGSLSAARTLLERAIAVDASFGPAYGALAVNSLQLGEQGTLPLREAREAARSAASTALDLDQTLPDAHLAMALVHIREDWRWSDAERALQACLAHAPTSAPCLRAHANLLAARGRLDEALASIERASEIEPRSAETHAQAGRLLLFARRYPEAAARLRTALSVEPRFAATHKLLSDAFWHGGMQADAQRAFLEWLALIDVPATELTFVEATLRRDGLPGLWRTLLQRPDKPGATHPGMAFKRATMHAALGEITPAVDALEAAVAHRDAGVMFLSVDPLFDALSEDLRFRGLLTRVGLPVPTSARSAAATRGAPASPSARGRWCASPVPSACGTGGRRPEMDGLGNELSACVPCSSGFDS